MTLVLAPFSRCEASINLKGPGLRGRTGRCPSKATVIRRLAVMLGSERDGGVCTRHAAIVDNGRTVYVA